MKYYKLIQNIGESQVNYLLEFGGEKRAKIEKRINFGRDNQPDYLLIEKTQNADSSESYTDIFPINSERELLKKIGNRVCWDYSGLHEIVWKKGKPYTWNYYKDNHEKI